MFKQMQTNAQRAILAALSGKTCAGEIRIDVTPGDLSAEIWIPAPGEDGPLNTLRRNGSLSWVAPAAPIVFDPQTGRPTFRLVAPVAVWSNASKLEKYLGQRWCPDGEPIEFSNLRLLRNVPEGVERFCYGRSERICLLLDRRPALIAAAVFPGALREAQACWSQQRLECIASILLARSGGSFNPRSFNMLERKSIAGLMRAAEIHDDTPHQMLRAVEKKLLQQAEDDRKLFHVLADPGLPLEELVQGMGSYS